MFKRLAIGAASVFAMTAAADLKVNSIFTDNMVLQREKPVPVWGTGDVGKQVTVTFDGATAKAMVGADGKWHATLLAMNVSNENREMKVTLGGETVVFKDVLVGDVWIASGQSNMEYSFCWWPYSVDLSKKFCHETPNFRHVRIACSKQNVPRENAPLHRSWSCVTGGVWFTATSVGCFFAQRVMEKTGKKIPIGLIESSWGGMNIEPYINPGFYGECDAKVIQDLKRMYDTNGNPATEKGRKAWDKYVADTKAFLADVEKRVAAGQLPVDKAPEIPCGHPYWSGCWQAMLAPYSRFPVKGAIWYQGCGNSGNGENYEHLLANMFQGWRKAWGYDLPCYWVQLAAYIQGEEDTDAEGGRGFAKIREGMRRAMNSIPNGGMAVTFDLGNPKDIHPKEKLHVGERLAQWALHNDYGFKDVVPSGPDYKSMKVEGDKARLSFDYVGSGLAVQDGRLG